MVWVIIRSIYGYGDLFLEQCPLRNPDDSLSHQSMGAHFQEILNFINLQNQQT